MTTFHDSCVMTMHTLCIQGHRTVVFLLELVQSVS